jgi:hypothetical protein
MSSRSIRIGLLVAALVMADWTLKMAVLELLLWPAPFERQLHALLNWYQLETQPRPDDAWRRKARFTAHTELCPGTVNLVWYEPADVCGGPLY